MGKQEIKQYRYKCDRCKNVYGPTEGGKPESWTYNTVYCDDTPYCTGHSELRCDKCTRKYK